MSRAALSEPTALEDMNARIVVDSGFSVIVLRHVMRWEEAPMGPAVPLTGVTRRVRRIT